jgi:hypothetical protein
MNGVLYMTDINYYRIVLETDDPIKALELTDNMLYKDTTHKLLLSENLIAKDGRSYIQFTIHPNLETDEWSPLHD